MLDKKSLALAKCRNDWVLNLDGDEVLSNELKQEIVETIQQNKLDALITPINDVFLGVPNSKHIKKTCKSAFFSVGLKGIMTLPIKSMKM